MKLNVDTLLPIIQEVNEGNLKRLVSEMRRQIVGLNWEDMEKVVQDQICLKNRKYGKGAVLLGP